MAIFDLNTYSNNTRLIAYVTISISIIAWAVELVGAVYVCPYCRVQRSVIGILGFILLVPFAHHWIAKYTALVVGFFGAVVASNQHFMGWKKVSAGKFSFNANLAIDPFILSGFALIIIIGLIALIMRQKPS